MDEIEDLKKELELKDKRRIRDIKRLGNILDEKNNELDHYIKLYQNRKKL